MPQSSYRLARAEAAKPSLILVRMHLGYGSPEQESFKADGLPLGKVFPKLARELQGRLRGELPPVWGMNMPMFPADAKGLATRDASGKVMNAIAPSLPALCGGSADLDPSTKTALKGQGDFNPPPSQGEDQQGSNGGGWSRAGRYLHFGVREHAMGAVAKGLAAHDGLIPFTAISLIFSDYMAVELGVRQGWERYIGAHGDMLGVERFGASAPADVLLREYGFTVDNVCKRAEALLARNALR